MDNERSQPTPIENQLSHIINDSDISQFIEYTQQLSLIREIPHDALVIKLEYKYLPNSASLKL